MKFSQEHQVVPAMNVDRDISFDLPCCVEGPSDFIPKAQYALQMLLWPLGINPVWSTKSQLINGSIYYGIESEKLSSDVITFRLAPDTLRFFTERFFNDSNRYDESSVVWREKEGDRYPVLFGGPAQEDDDLIASAFFWLSGWQEYTIPNRDQHGRFPYHASLQAVLDTAHEPAVDIYREVLKKQLLEKSVPVKQRTWGGKAWAFCPTHDIDYIWKWRPGMVYREIVERFLSNSAGESIGARFARLGTFASDAVKPRDIFRYAFTRMIDEVKQRKGKATYFIKTGAHGPHDVFYSSKHGFLKRTFEQLKTLGFEVGLHPSYYAHTHAGYLKEEKERLELAWGQGISSVRQHYLRYEHPQTLRMHEAAGFAIDSTLAFADHEGFRYATCHPFLRYDLVANAPASSWEMPLCFMDGTLFNYRMLSLDESSVVCQKLISTCKKYNGVCVGLWHNMLWDEMDFPGWGAHFTEILDYVVKEEGAIDSLRGAMDSYFIKRERP
ncbi:MAG: polysaccharide deacetylase family protein [Rhodothermales bacterium]